jgi:hypothetical protein
MRAETHSAPRSRSRSRTQEARRGDPDSGVGSATPEIGREQAAGSPPIPDVELSPNSAARLRRLRVAALRAVARKRGEEEPSAIECERAAWEHGLGAAYRSIAKGPRAETAVREKPSVAGVSAPERSLPLAWSAAVGMAAFASRLLLAPWGAFWDPREHLPAKLPPATDNWWGDVLVAIERMWILGIAKLGSFAGAVLSVAAIGSVALVSAVLFLVVFSVVSKTPASRRSAVFVSAALVLLTGVALNVWTPTLIPSSPGLIGFAAFSPLTLLLVKPRRSRAPYIP